MTATNNDRNYLDERTQQELTVLRAYHEAVLNTADPGIIILDSTDVVVSENEASRRLWQSAVIMQGAKIEESSLMRKCPELKHHLEAARGAQPKTVTFNCSTPAEKQLIVTVRPITEDGGPAIIGTLIYMEDITPREDLQQTVEELQTTAEELQSTNEELETTNEELQSTNEELETTNEELQSTNEELETTNEELKSLNEELEDINEELAKRSRELDESNARYLEMVEQMPWPMFLTRSDGVIGVYNTAAKKLFGFATPSANGMMLREVPMASENHAELAGHLSQASASRKSIVVDSFDLSTNIGKHLVRLHINPMRLDGKSEGALVMFEPMRHTAMTDGHASAEATRLYAANSRVPASDGSSPDGQPKKKTAALSSRAKNNSRKKTATPDNKRKKPTKRR